MKGTWGLAILVAVGLHGPGVTAAVTQEGGFCFPGEPAPGCRVVGLVEGAVVHRFAGDLPTGSDEGRWEATWEVGVLVNGDGDDAWGGTFLIGTGEYRPRLALKARYRRWLGDGVTADLGLGPMTHSTSTDAWGVGVMADAGIGYRDWVGAFARLEVLPREGGGTAAAGYIGGRLGSWPAVGASAAGWLALLIVLLNADFA